MELLDWHLRYGVRHRRHHVRRSSLSGVADAFKCMCQATKMVAGPA
jgi:hypothetical protein